MSPDGPDLHFVHRVEQAHGAAASRIDSLLGWIDDWVRDADLDDEQKLDVVDDPNMFLALQQIMLHKVDVRELPNMLAAAVMRLAKDRLKGSV